MSLNNNETPMLHRFWQNTGGTLIEEFYAVRRGPGHSERRIDGVIIKNGETAIKRQNEVEVAGQDIIVVQVKTGRLGMYVMGQGLFSARLMRSFRPKSIESVILVEKYDDVLAPLLEEFPDVRVVIDDRDGVRRSSK